MKIRKHCSRCEKRIDFDKTTFYLSIFQRENHKNRDSAFLCINCFKQFVKLMEGTQDEKK